MTEDQIRKIVKEELRKLIPEFFGRSLLQIKEYFFRNIN